MASSHSNKRKGHRFDDRRVLLNPALEAYLYYVDERADWKWARKVLPTLARDLLEEYATITERRLRDVLQGRSRPHQTMRAWLVTIARDWERSAGDIEEFRRRMGPPPATKVRERRRFRLGGHLRGRRDD